MQAVCGFHEQMAAVLHDVVEDTSVTLEELRRRGFPEAVVAAVDALSRRPGEPYLAFIDRAGSHRIARPVKLADLHDNLDPRRLARFSTAQQKRLVKKYSDALRRLAR
jgi:(p)ppGpp synthase/HD superfamily hydrolase